VTESGFFCAAPSNKPTGRFVNNECFFTEVTGACAAAANEAADGWYGFVKKSSIGLAGAL
jgi:hypothetical protein